MTDPDRKPETPDLPPAAGTEVPDTDAGAVADEEGRDPTEGPTSEQNRTAAETTRAEGGDEPPD
ncbi:hypothetical protein Kpho02_61350 [Kitasatospora phosalacinea]|uniref:Uncharacterized protein n=1 Tax=Kitasatospora phosalacinea TaxID=2065 RepID=A0A9W6QBN3_9ACTN|nr:hypothetical protein [Kitasatospora phosalacinea]GLW73837.1 hypothetical protein Kpho02_61350 [Kitasatospora phosalacinea]